MRSNRLEKGLPLLGSWLESRWRHTATALACWAFLLVCGPANLRGQESQEPAFEEEVEVTEVLVDVVVTDNQGHIVVGLDEDDFIVREQGEPVEVVSATFYSNRRFLGSSAQAKELNIDIDTVPVNRYFILFFHHQRSLLPRLGANLMDAGHRSKQWAKGSLLPNDYVAVASYFPKLNVLDFTNDVDLLVETIDLAVQGKDFETPVRTRATDLPSLTQAMPVGDADRIYEAIAMIAEGAGAIRGRKNMILYSIGFGREEAFGFFLPDARFYPPMVQTLNDNHVSVYPIDLLAMDLSPFFQANRPSEVLSAMAHDTGGRFFFNFTNYLSPLEKVTEDNNGYYLLSYLPRRGVERDVYQRVEVLTKNANFQVRHREGYVPGEGYPYAERAAVESKRRPTRLAAVD